MLQRVHLFSISLTFWFNHYLGTIHHERYVSGSGSTQFSVLDWIYWGFLYFPNTPFWDYITQFWLLFLPQCQSFLVCFPPRKKCFLKLMSYVHINLIHINLIWSVTNTKLKFIKREQARDDVFVTLVGRIYFSLGNTVKVRAPQKV